MCWQFLFTLGLLPRMKSFKGLSIKPVSFLVSLSYPVLTFLCVHPVWAHSQCNLELLYQFSSYFMCRKASFKLGLLISCVQAYMTSWDV